MKTTIKIAVIAMMGMCLGVKAQDYVPKTGGTFTGGVKAPSFSVTSSEYSSSLTGNLLQFSRNGFSYIDNKDPNGSIAIRTGGTGNVDLLVKSNGFVGVGVNPQFNFDVNGHIHMKDQYNFYGAKFRTNDYTTMTFDSRAWRTAQGINGKAFSFRTHSDTGSMGHESLAIYYGQSGKIVMAHNGGKVGIGTTSPSAKLEISHHENMRTVEINPQNQLDVTGNSSLTIKEFVPSIEFSDSSNSSSAAVVFANNSSFFIGKKSGVQMRSSELFNVNLNSGKVGIGTLTTGNHKLAVEGSIGAREIKVEANGWSDFVFYEDYELPTLKEVENHIKEKGHLKDIPSAKQIEQNGFFLGEMDAKLLQKIEELTLYTIAQEKEIEELKKEKTENKQQQKEIDELKKQNSEIKELKALVQKLLKNKN